jgi:zinc protease
MVLFMASSVPSAPASASADTSFVLGNGLKVILAPQPGSPVVSARIIVKAGSSSEIGEAEHGLAHLMEHMAFKGTARRKVGEVSAEVERNGGEINAYTSYDETVYYLALPSEKLETAVDILSDIVFSPSYDPEEYAREKEVVIEEIRRADDNPDRGLYDAFFEDAFGKGSPYGHRILGDASTVSAAGRDTAFAFHQRFYRPDNCVLVVTGGFEAAEARELADRFLAGLPDGGARPVRPAAAAPPEGGPRIRVIRSAEAQVPKTVMGFGSPSARSAEAPALELLSSVLSEGESSRLVENVRYRKSLVTQISSYAETFTDAGLFLVHYESSPEKLLPALKAVVEELNSLSSSPPAADELARAAALTSKGFLSRQETPASLGGLISTFEVYYGDYRLKDAFMNFWSRIGPGDLAAMAAGLFVPENLTVTVLLPQDAPALDEAAVREAVAGLAPAAPSPSSSGAGRAAFEPITLKCGARLFVMRDPTLPLVEVKAALLGGRFAEAPGQEGLNSLMAAVWDRSTGGLASPELARAIEGLGASVTGFSGRNSFGLDGSFLGSNWREGLAILAQLLSDPAFAQADFDSEKEEHLTYLKSLDESLPDRLFRLARKALFRSHPYGVEYHGTYESVERLTREDAQGLYRRLVRPERMVFAVAGDVTPQEAAEALDAALASWAPGPAGEAPSVPPAPPALLAPVMASEALERAQTHIAVTFLAPGMGTRDQAALEVLDSILSGMGGILFTELRDRKSLAYTVQSSYGAGLGTGSFSFYIGCAPDKAGEALAGILGIIRAARGKAYDAATVEGAKTYLAGINRIRRQTLRSRVGESALFDVYGLGQDRNERLLEEVAAVTPEDVRRVADTYLALDRAVLSVVGSEASIKAVEGLFPEFKR